MSINNNFTGATELGDTSVYGEFKLKKNLLYLNDGEDSDKVSDGKAGIQINRGTNAVAYNILFDESDRKLKIGLGNNLKTVATENNIISIEPITNEEIDDLF